MKIPDVDISLSRAALRSFIVKLQQSRRAIHECVVEKSFLNDSGCFEASERENF
jgi:hypothetical protein